MGTLSFSLPPSPPLSLSLSLSSRTYSSHRARDEERTLKNRVFPVPNFARRLVPYRKCRNTRLSLSGEAPEARAPEMRELTRGGRGQGAGEEGGSGMAVATCTRCRWTKERQTGTGRLFEINRNVTIFRRGSSRTVRLLHRAFPFPPPRPPFTSLPRPRRYARQNRDKRIRGRWLRVQGAGKKRTSGEGFRRDVT